MRVEEPKGPPTKVASAWMAISASIILFFMVVIKTLGRRKFPYIPGLPENVITGSNDLIFMKESSNSHYFIYFLLFALVFISAFLGFFYKDDE